jgi:hypothetical protein
MTPPILKAEIFVDEVRPELGFAPWPGRPELVVEMPRFEFAVAVVDDQRLEYLSAHLQSPN